MILSGLERPEWSEARGVKGQRGQIFSGRSLYLCSNGLTSNDPTWRGNTAGEKHVSSGTGRSVSLQESSTPHPKESGLQHPEYYLGSLS